MPYPSDDHRIESLIAQPEQFFRRMPTPATDEFFKELLMTNPPAIVRTRIAQRKPGLSHLDATPVTRRRKTTQPEPATLQRTNNARKADTTCAITR